MPYHLRIFRLNHVDALELFFAENKATGSEFYRRWHIDLVADDENLRQTSNQHAYTRIEELKRVKPMSWIDFLINAKKVHEQFLEFTILQSKRGGEISHE